MSKLTKEQHQEIRKLYESGRSKYSIAKEFGVTIQTVDYHTRHLYSKFQARLRIRNEKIRELYLNQGLTPVQIAKEVNLTSGGVCCVLRLMGIYIRPHVTSDEYLKMIDLRNDGLSNAQIALRMGRKIDTVRRHIGKQPSEITVNSIRYGAKLRSINANRRNSAKLAMKRKLEEEARIAEERRAAEEAAREAARIAEEERRICEENLREIFSTVGIPIGDDFRIESADQGNTLIANLHEKTRATNFTV